MSQVLVAHDLSPDCVAENILLDKEIDGVIGNLAPSLWGLTKIDNWIPYNNFISIDGSSSDKLWHSYYAVKDTPTEQIILYVLQDNVWGSPHQHFIYVYKLDKSLWTFTRLSWWVNQSWTPIIDGVYIDWDYIYVSRKHYDAPWYVYIVEKYTISTNTREQIEYEYVWDQINIPTRYPTAIWTEITSNEIVSWNKKFIYSSEYIATKVRYPLITIEDI